MGKRPRLQWSLAVIGGDEVVYEYGIEREIIYAYRCSVFLLYAGGCDKCPSVLSIEWVDIAAFGKVI